jgi:MFS family permease
MLLLGLGVGSCFPALMTLAMADVPPQDAGLASGLVNTTAQVGGALGLAVLATASATHSKHLTGAGKPLAEALTSGYHVAFFIGAGLVAGAIAIALALAATGSPAHNAHETREGAQAPSGPEHGAMETG